MDLRDLVLCKLCAALLTYDSRPEHVAWHARINARLGAAAKAMADTMRPATNPADTGETT